MRPPDLTTATIYFSIFYLMLTSVASHFHLTKRLDDADLRSGLQSVVVGSQLDVSLLVAGGPDQGVDLGDVDLVKLLDGLLDLILVALGVNDEDQGVVVFDLLHGGLGGQGELDDGELVVAGPRGDGLGRALGVAGQLEGAGPLEVDRGPDLSLLVLVTAGFDGVGRFPSFGGHVWIFWIT